MEARPDLWTESERKGRASIRVWLSTPATGARATLSTPALPDESVIEVRFPPSRGVSGHQPWLVATPTAGRTTHSATKPTTLRGLADRGTDPLRHRWPNRDRCAALHQCSQSAGL